MLPTIGVKSQLAKLLATENISVIHDSSAKTAYFDLQSRVVTLPVWSGISDDLYDLLVVHEVGHALDTNWEAWQKSLDDICDKVTVEKKDSARRLFIKDLINIVEDVRIDKRQKRRYPGARRNYHFGYRELMDRNFFGLEGRDVNEMNFADRLNLYFKGGTDLGIKFTDEEKVFVQRADSIETFDEVSALVLDIYRYLEDKINDMIENMEENSTTKKLLIVKSDGDPDGEDLEEVDLNDYDEVHMDRDTFDKMNEKKDKEESDSTTKSDTKDAKSEDESEGNASFEGEGEDGDGGDQGEQKARPAFESATNKGNDEGNVKKEKAPPAQGAGHSTKIIVHEEFEFTANTERAAEKNQESLLDKSGTKVVNVAIPMVDLSKTVDDYKVFLSDHMKSPWNNGTYDRQPSETALKAWVISQKSMVDHMVNEFEMNKAAAAHSRQSVAKTGTLDLSKIHSYKFNEDLFKRVTRIPEGKNHGFVILMDWSGSMSNCLADTVKQMITLAFFCRRVRVPFEIYIFRTPEGNENSNNQFRYTATGLNWKFDLTPVRLRNVLSSRMSVLEFNEAIFNLWMLSTNQNKVSFAKDYLSSTPLIQSVLALSDIVNDFVKTNKVEIANCIVMTDGGPDPQKVWYYGNSTNVDHSLVYHSTFVITDPITKKTYTCKSNNILNYYNVFLKILKDRTNCNLIGYYIIQGTRSGRASHFHFPGGVTVDESERKLLQKHKFLATKNSNFDEYYLLVSDRYSKEASLEIDGKMTKKKMAAKFSEFADSKNNKKLFVKSLMNRVAKSYNEAV